MKTKKFELVFKDHLNLNIELTKKTLLNYKIVLKIFNFLHKKIENKKNIYIYGNGGSFADASHFASEVTATYKKRNRVGLPFYLMSSNLSSLTAWSNDIYFESYLEREVQSLIKPGDVLILISTSGGNRRTKQSINLLNAAKLANKNKINVIGFLGNNGGDLKKYCNLSYIVDSKNTPSIQENHKLIFHIICEMFDIIY
jgi:D-sedoheptulose 7-phosphate isomerase